MDCNPFLSQTPPWEAIPEWPAPWTFLSETVPWLRDIGEKLILDSENVATRDTGMWPGIIYLEYPDIHAFLLHVERNPHLYTPGPKRRKADVSHFVESIRRNPIAFKPVTAIPRETVRELVEFDNLLATIKQWNPVVYESGAEEEPMDDSDLPPCYREFFKGVNAEARAFVKAPAPFSPET